MPDNGSKTQLKRILESHEGRVHAITARELSVNTQRPDRAVRLSILELIWEGLPVLSATEPPAGYYLPKTKAEWLEYDHQLKNRIIEDAKRKAQVKKNVALYFLPAKQGKLLL